MQSSSCRGQLGRAVAKALESARAPSLLSFLVPTVLGALHEQKEKQSWDGHNGCVDLLIVLPLRHPGISSRQRYAFYLLFGNISLAPVVWDASHALTPASSTCVVLSYSRRSPEPIWASQRAREHTVAPAGFTVIPQTGDSGLLPGLVSGLDCLLGLAGVSLALEDKEMQAHNRTRSSLRCITVLRCMILLHDHALQVRFKKKSMPPRQDDDANTLSKGLLW